MARTVKLHMTDDQIETIVKLTGLPEFNKAISYLSTWAFDTYDTVSICTNDRDIEFTAVYSHSMDRDVNPKKYVLGAVWHEDHFGFHS